MPGRNFCVHLPVHKIRHLRLFMHRSPDPVPDKFPHYAEPVAFTYSCIAREISVTRLPGTAGAIPQRKRCSVTSINRCARTSQPPTATVRAVSPIYPL